jgi:hypothetical protein
MRPLFVNSPSYQMSLELAAASLLTMVVDFMQTKLPNNW